MEVKRPFVFQTDSEIVQKQYRENLNYLIEYSENAIVGEYCTIYFCSNDIYYPNTEDIFRKRIVEEDFYEWYGTRVEKSHKHIFIRDIFKQWYLAGINSKIDTPAKLLEFLRHETKGFKIITIGSSAGGYAAILYGSLLNVCRVIAFNPQSELKSEMEKSNETKNPLLFRLKETPLFKYFDLLDWINSQTDIYYFYSNKSVWDIEQCNHIKNRTGIHVISFSTAHHGIPFLKVCLSKVLNSDKDSLSRLSDKIHNPWFFSINMVGFRRVLIGTIKQLYKAYKKRR